MKSWILSILIAASALGLITFVILSYACIVNWLENKFRIPTIVSIQATMLIFAFIGLVCLVHTKYFLN